jgi:hypothetical protein
VRTYVSRYTAAKADELLSTFKDEAARCALFLRNVESVELYHWADGMSTPSRDFAVKIHNASASLTKHRQLMSVAAQKGPGPGSASVALVELHVAGSPGTRIERWLVSHGLGTGDALALSKSAETQR